MPEPLTKGYSLLSYITPLKRVPTQWQAVLDGLDDRSRAFFIGPIYAHEWYPRAHLHALMRSLHALHRGDEEAIRALGAMAADYQVQKIYRIFLRFATPAQVFLMASKLWARQSNTGAFTVIAHHDSQLIGDLVEDDLPIGLPALIAGWSDAIITMLGRTPYPTQYEELAPGHWRFHVAWYDR